MAYKLTSKQVREMAELVDEQVRNLGWYDTDHYEMHFMAGSPMNGQPYFMRLAAIHNGGFHPSGYPGLPSRLGSTARDAAATLTTYSEVVRFAKDFYGQ